jgi:hypothetical protein
MVEVTSSNHTIGQRGTDLSTSVIGSLNLLTLGDTMLAAVLE